MASSPLSLTPTRSAASDLSNKEPPVFWEKSKPKAVVPGIERCGALLGSWVSFRDGDTAHANAGQWHLAYAEVRYDGIYVHDKRDVASRKDDTVSIPWNGTFVEIPQPSEETRCFSLRIDLRNFDERSIITKPPVKHWMAFSSRTDRTIWIRALAPYLTQKPSGMIEMNYVSRPLKPVFGQPLSSVIDRDGTQIPDVIATCLDFLQANNAHETEGIFRKSGNNTAMKSIKDQFDKNDHVAMLENGDPHVIAGVMKAFLQELPDPLIPYGLFESFLSVQNFPEETRTAAYNSLLCQLPAENQWLLSTLLTYLKYIAASSETNLMGVDNLAIVFAPSILRKQDATPQEEVMFLGPGKQCFVELLEKQDQFTLLTRCIAEEVRLLFGEQEVVNYGMLAKHTTEIIRAHSLGVETILAQEFNEIRCGDTYGNDIVLGSDNGVATVQYVPLQKPIFDKSRRLTSAGSDLEKKLPKLEFAPLERKKNYQKISVIDEIDLIIAICGRNSTLVAYHVVKGQWFSEKLHNSKGCHDYTYGWRNRRFYIVAAINTNLYMFELEKMDIQGIFHFTQKKEFYVPAPPILLKLMNDSIVLAFRELAEFHMLDVETSHVEPLCHSTGNTERVPRDVVHLQHWNEYFVAFTDIGVFLDVETYAKSRKNVVLFDEPPRQIVYMPPHFILLVSSEYISVLRVTDGIVIQKLKIEITKKDVDSPTGPRSANQVKGTLLRLEGTVLRTWKKRHFVISGNVVLIFKNEFESTPIDTILLRNADIRETTGVLRKKNVISILSQGQRTFLAAAEDSESQDWLKALSSSTGDRKSVFVSPESVPRKSTVERGLPIEVGLWTVEQVGVWLVDIGLGELVEQFKEKNVNGDALLNLDKESIKAFEISIGKRLVLTRRAQLLKDASKITYNASTRRPTRQPSNQARIGSFSPPTSSSTLINARFRLLTAKDYVLASLWTGSSNEIFQLKFIPA